MAMFDGDQFNRLTCTCGSPLLFKRPLFIFNKEKTGLIGKRQLTELRCAACGQLVKTISTFSGEIQS